MREQAAFLDAIFADPSDDVARLVYADWLDDYAGRAGSARAEFIRVQVALERMAREARPAALLQRQKELWQEHGAAWWRDLHTAVRADVIYRRGFIDEFRGAAGVFFRDPAPFWALAPAQVLALTAPHASHLHALARMPQTARLCTLELTGGQVAEASLQRVLGSPHLPRVRTLVLSRLGLDALGVRVLLESPLMAQLRTLNLKHNNLSDEGVRHLAESPAAAGLRELCLTDNQVGTAGALALAASPWLEKLGSLQLGWNVIERAGAEALRRRFGARLEMGRQVV